MDLQEQIFATTAQFVARVEPVTVAEWPGTDGKLYVRELSALEDEQFGDACRRSAIDGKTSVAAEAVVLALVDEGGKRIFTAKDAAARLAAGPVGPIDAVFSKFMELRPKKGDAEKKSPTPTSGPTLPSPTDSVTPTLTD